MNEQYGISYFETEISQNQELSFEALQAEMNNRNLVLDQTEMKELRLINEEDLYTNLALLLSDQCPFSTFVAYFQGSDSTTLHSRWEFKGSLIKQMHEVYEKLDLLSNIRSSFSKINRIDTRDYPEVAIREAWLTCLVHSDYSVGRSSIIKIYDDRFEFVSMGGLISIYSMDSIRLGASLSRNPNLANIFFRMQLIECFGTGIGKIMRCYDELEQKPIFETAPGVFRVTLPNCNTHPLHKQTKEIYKNLDSFNEEKDMLMEHANAYGHITRKEAEEVLGSGTTKAFKVLRELCDEGKLRTRGNGKKVKYIL